MENVYGVRREEPKYSKPVKRKGSRQPLKASIDIILSNRSNVKNTPITKTSYINKENKENV